MKEKGVTLCKTVVEIGRKRYVSVCVCVKERERKGQRERESNVR